MHNFTDKKTKNKPFPEDKTNPFGVLPEWDLSDLYESPASKKIQTDLRNAKDLVKSFAKNYENNLAKLTASEMLKCITRQEQITQIIGRLMSYAVLRYYQKTTDTDRTKFLADTQEKITNLSSPMVFFSLEFNKIDESHLNNLIKQSVQLKRYKPAFNRMRAMKPYQLNDSLEKFLHDQSVVGASAWNKLFDETMASLTFKVDKTELPLETTLNLLSENDRTQRKKGAKAIAKVLKKNISLFSRITNTLVKEKSIEDLWRKFPNPQHARHLANDVEPEVVSALRSAVVNSYAETSHRYYKMKAKWLGLKKLEIWDRNAPFPNTKSKIISWDAAREIVLSAYQEFDPKIADLAKNFFENGWIDAGVKPGKAPGAFAHPTVTTVHPYIMLNYLGKPRDVMTLAHELGHGVHQLLASKQGEILSNTPLTLAETASVFGEMLTFQKLLKVSEDAQQRKQLLASKIEDMINTVIRQISFYDFECRVHEARIQGELTPDEICKIWMDVSQESLGGAFNFMRGYETFWAYVPHFIHSPFYVYAYAFGDGLVNALYSVYKTGDRNFKQKYLNMLAAGGSKHHTDLLKPFNLNAADPKFWLKGLSLLSSMIDELEQLEN